MILLLGTFLVRFSSSKPGSFALAFVMQPQKVINVIITTTKGGFTIIEQNQQKFFSDLQSIIQYYSSVLRQPFISTLPEEP